MAARGGVSTSGAASDRSADRGGVSTWSRGAASDLSADRHCVSTSSTASDSSADRHCVSISGTESDSSADRPASDSESDGSDDNENWHDDQSLYDAQPVEETKEPATPDPVDEEKEAVAGAQRVKRGSGFVKADSRLLKYAVAVQRNQDALVVDDIAPSLMPRRTSATSATYADVLTKGRRR